MKLELAAKMKIKLENEEAERQKVLSQPAGTEWQRVKIEREAQEKIRLAKEAEDERIKKEIMDKALKESLVKQVKEQIM